MKHVYISRYRHTHSRGSALILTVVLTTLLALVGVLFALTSRLDRIASTATHQNRTLGMAVDSVVSIISEQLVRDVPGVANAEYYDFPDVNDRWLASLEPQRDPTGSGAFYWGQISDITGALTETNQVRPALLADHEPLDVDSASGDLVAETLADADGDGVGDAKWFRLSIVGAMGQPLYVAVRVIDHGGMLNVNTALKFVPRSDSRDAEIDGSSEMQINIVALADSDPGNPMDKDQLDAKAVAWQGARAQTAVGPLVYENGVIWNFDAVGQQYTPFDISDELKLRNRFMINHRDIKSRLESTWKGVFQRGPQTPLPTPSYELANWYDCVSGDSNNYDYRHICTTYNVDRILDPNGLRKMVNVKWLSVAEKAAKAQEIHQALLRGIGPGYADRDRIAAQLAVNLVDYLDQDPIDQDTMTQLVVGSDTYYGFEAQPFISSVSFAISAEEPEDPNQNHFSIELYNPYDVAVSLQNCRFEFFDGNGGERYPIELTTRADTIGPKARLSISSDDRYPGPLPTSFSLARYSNGDAGPSLVEEYDIYLTRLVDSQDGNSVSVCLDAQITDPNWFAWEKVNGGETFVYQREDPNDTEDDWRIVYQEMFDQHAYDPDSSGDRVNLNLPMFRSSADEVAFPTIGEISRIPIIGPSPNKHGSMGAWISEYRSSYADPNARTIDEQKRVFLDLEDRNVSGIFQQLTALNPARFARDTTEDRLKGRVNINTAPFFVMQTLPWLYSMSSQASRQLGRSVELAKSIVDYRNSQGRGFKSIGELLQVPDIDVLRHDRINNRVSLDPNDPFGPDLTPDAVQDDLEERDLLFARISNLVTVRSDVFSAYILIRLGADGPQKRVLAILDRSQVDSVDDRVKVLALHQVPDPR
jgi:hypothetical protein